MNVLFICHGNICRSPLAEAMLRKKYEENQINAEVSSAGFESFNINEPPDPRAQEMANRHGLKMDHVARIFLKSDFDRFDKIYVMDMKNYRDVKFLARNENDKQKVDYLMNVIEPGKNKTIADPFTRGERDFDTIYGLIDKATDKIVELAKSN
jgi:protein-tyrosine phosphatase